MKESLQVLSPTHTPQHITPQKLKHISLLMRHSTQKTFITQKFFPGVAVDPDHVHHTNTSAKHHQHCPTAPTGQPGKTRIGNINNSPLMTHHPNTTALMNNPANLMRI